MINTEDLQEALNGRQLMDPGSYVKTPTSSELFAASVEEVLDLDNSNSRVRTQGIYFAQQDADVQEMIDSGDIPESVVDAHRKGGRARQVDYRKLAQWANENIGTNFDKDTETYKEWMRARADEREKMFSYAEGWGYMAMLGGGIVGAAADPVVWATSLIGAPSAAAKVGSSAMGVVGRRMLSNAGVNMAAEVPVQMLAMEQREQLGIQYGVGDMALNLVFAAGAGSAFGIPQALGDAARLARVQDIMDANNVVMQFLEMESPPDSLAKLFNDLDVEDSLRMNQWLKTIDSDTPLVEAEKTIQAMNRGLVAEDAAKAIEEASVVAQEAQRVEAVIEGRMTPEEYVEVDFDPELDTMGVNMEAGKLGDVIAEIDQQFDAEDAALEAVRVCGVG